MRDEIDEIGKAVMLWVARAWVDSRGFAFTEQDIEDLAALWSKEITEAEYAARVRASPDIEEKLRCGYEKRVVQ